MNVLQIPIIDEYYVAPQDPASHLRSTDFAISAGFGALRFEWNQVHVLTDVSRRGLVANARERLRRCLNEHSNTIAQHTASPSYPNCTLMNLASRRR